MSIYEAIGFVWVIFTSALATFGLIYFMWQGVKAAYRQYWRGKFEESLDIKKCVETKFLERMAR